MRLYILSAVAMAASVAAQSQAIAAPSFNCRTAHLPAEKVVCGNQSLHRVDRNIARLYADTIAQARAVSDARAVRTVRDSQREFLRERNSCGWDYQCVRLAYRGQGQILRGFLRQLD